MKRKHAVPCMACLSKILHKILLTDQYSAFTPHDAKHLQQANLLRACSACLLSIHKALLAGVEYLQTLQSWLNYAELLEGRFNPDLPVEKMGVVDYIMLPEREAIFCKTLYQAAQKGNDVTLSSLSAAVPLSTVS